MGRPGNGEKGSDVSPGPFEVTADQTTARSLPLFYDLDDGVKTNYPKFGAALKKIPGLGADA